MGVVYEVLDRSHGTRVALKTLRRSSPQALARLKNEFRALQDFHHPNLVSLGELVCEEGLWFFTMELVEGVDLIEHVRSSAAEERVGSVPTLSDRTVGETAETMAKPPGPTAQGGPTTGELAATISTGPTMSEGASADPAAAAGGPATAPAPAGEPPPGAATFDEIRLRRAFSQLAGGLCALHAGGKVHRDLKPSNILVTREGRVVVLDFGLVTGVDVRDQSQHQQVVGTAAYMAPEQAAAHPLGPEADWYSFGVLLYRALTGELPFRGSPLEVLMAKQRHDPRPPRSLVPEVPEDLDSLCQELLRFSPEARPAGARVFRRLGVSPPELVDPPSASLTETPLFVGREEELAVLREAFEATRRGTSVAVIIEGESGIGKSALVRRFADELEEKHADMVVLTARCYERESVPFKAVDGAIDALGRHLAELSDRQAGALLPRAAHAALLGEVFPTLRQVRLVAQARRPRDREGIDPQERRARLFAAVRECLGRLADRQPVLLWVDDLQWADADSLTLLAEVLRPPEAPPLLLIATQRHAPGGTPLSGGRDQPLVRRGAQRLHLGRLPPADARDLAKHLLGKVQAPQDVSPAHIAVEGHGHPLFIDELVRRAATEGGAGKARVKLDEVLGARVAGTDPIWRRVVELVSVAGTPVTRATLARAAGLATRELRRCLSGLRVMKLVQTTGSRETDRAAPYHDRIRESVLERLDPEVRREHHRDLALALEAGPRVDPQLLAVHWHGSGDSERAAEYYERSAQAADQALAFDRAARLYQRAIDLQPPGTDARSLRLSLATALANAGRGEESAVTFLGLTEGASPSEVQVLRQRAAEQYLRGGYMDEGLAAIREVLDALGMSYPRTPARALASLLFRRALLRVKGLRFRATPPSELSQEALTRLDACWSLATTLATVDTIRGSDFNARSVLMALKLGEPLHLTRALAVEGGYASHQGGKVRRRVARLLEAQRQVAATTNAPETYAWTLVGKAFAAYYVGEFRPARDCFREILEFWRDRCVGMAWEQSTMVIFELFARSYLGELAELSRRVPQQVSAALDRGDLYLATTLRLSILNSAWLVRGDDAEAERVMREALAGWSAQGAVTHHWFGLTAQAQLDLYRGDGAGGYARLRHAWRGLARTLVLRVQLVRIEAWHLWARCALAAALEAERPARLLREALRSARRIERERMPWANPLAWMVRGAVAACRGDRAAAAATLRRAQEAFTEAEMTAYAAAAQRRYGEMLGGAEGREAVAAADAWMKQEKVADPARWTAMLAPGFPSPASAPAVRHEEDALVPTCSRS